MKKSTSADVDAPAPAPTVETVSQQLSMLDARLQQKKFFLSELQSTSDKLVRPALADGDADAKTELISVNTELRGCEDDIEDLVEARDQLIVALAELNKDAEVERLRRLAERDAALAAVEQLILDRLYSHLAECGELRAELYATFTERCAIAQSAATTPPRWAGLTRELCDRIQFTFGRASGRDRGSINIDNWLSQRSYHALAVADAAVRSNGRGK